MYTLAVPCPPSSPSSTSSPSSGTATPQTSLTPPLSSSPSSGTATPQTSSTTTDDPQPGEASQQHIPDPNPPTVSQTGLAPPISLLHSLVLGPPTPGRSFAAETHNTHPISQPASHYTPRQFFKLPWYSVPDAAFPPSARAVRRKAKKEKNRNQGSQQSAAERIRLLYHTERSEVASHKPSSEKKRVDKMDKPAVTKKAPSATEKEADWPEKLWVEQMIDHLRDRAEVLSQTMGIE